MDCMRKFVVYSLDWFREWMDRTGEQEPDFSLLREFPRLPPLLEFYDGTKVNSLDDWQKRKKEIKELLCKYFLGIFPEKAPAIVDVRIAKSCQSENATHQVVDLTFCTKNRAKITIELMMPVGKGPFPVLLTQSNHRSWGLQALSRGYLVCIYPAADINDQSGVFEEAYPECDWALIPRRAWMASRVVDYLFTLDEVDRDRIAITGHSRNGKQSLIAAAFDERITAVISSSSGVGGACPYRYMSEDAYGESVEFMTRSFPEWFHPRLRFFTGREHLLPMDNHGLLGLIAPRYCLISSAYNDDCESALAVEASYMAAKSVYEFMNKEEALRIRWRPGEHDTNATDIHSYIDWCDYAFGRGQYDVFTGAIVHFDWNDWQRNIPKQELEDAFAFSKKGNIGGEEKRRRILWFLGDAPPKGINSVELVSGRKEKSDEYFTEQDEHRHRQSRQPDNVRRLPIRFSENISGSVFYNASLKKPTKAVIWLHPYSYAQGYTGYYLRGDRVYHYLAANGFLVMAFDQMGFGYRLLEGQDFYRRYPRWSRLGKMVRDVSGAVDYLLSGQDGCGEEILSLVDKDHIYCVGYALGGLVALYAGALDTRIAGVASFCGFTPMRTDTDEKSTGGIRRLWELHSLLPRLGLFDGREAELPYDYEDVLSLIAPRPTLIVSAEDDRGADSTDIRKCIDKARDEWLGRPNGLTHVELQDYNRFQQEQNKIVPDWIRGLDNDSAI
jgi:cephalosporin-C deacetylase-like acetyl esterase